MTRSVDQSKATNYLIKAENSLRIAKIALKEKAYDTALMERGWTQPYSPNPDHN
jgi:hypothetical protein